LTLEAGLLLLTVFLPLAGAIVVVLLGPQRQVWIRWVSLLISLAVLGCSVILAARFLGPERSSALAEEAAVAGARLTFRPVFVPGAAPDNPHATTWDWVDLGPGRIQFYLGVDGISIWLVFLTAVLFPATVLISWGVQERVHEYFGWLLALKTAMLGVFVSFDIVLAYIFFEATLIPLFFLIGIWGGPERRYAARKFFAYTFVGSVLTLVGVIAVVLACYEQTGLLTFSIPRLVSIVQEQLSSSDPKVVAYWQGLEHLFFALLAIGFAIKVPLVPLHTWLPLAHVEAPTAGSVDLAGVLLKIGSYGFLRLCLPLAPDASLAWGAPLIAALGAIGIVYGAFCAYAQDDIKRLVAYSSISHLGLVMLAMLTLTSTGLAGSLLHMINHGLTTGALFLLVGMLYDRYHVRNISAFGGLLARLPTFGFWMIFVCLASVGLPGLNGFVGEVLCLFGVAEFAWQHGHGTVLLVLAASGLIWGAWYTFTVLRRVLMGPLKEPDGQGQPVSDLHLREKLTLAPIGVLCLVLGVYPQPVLRSAQPDLEVVARIAQLGRERVSLAASGKHADTDLCSCWLASPLEMPARSQSPQPDQRR